MDMQNITDEQLVQLAQKMFPKFPLEQIMHFIQKFKAQGLTNAQIIQIVWATEQKQKLQTQPK